MELMSNLHLVLRSGMHVYSSVAWFVHMGDSGCEKFSDLETAGYGERRVKYSS
jgi:hypothetical protein